ncbi:MAG: GerMN domain-containing protein [Actinomycetota bacterium]|nr:GerMN domain-containing protein [Actinomycetota bacterium]
MDKNKKNFDYWDKYYGSGKNRKKSYSDGKKDHDGKYLKSGYKNKKYGNDKYEPEGKIIGSEYKVKPTVRKKKRSPVLRLTILIIVVFLAGFFTFYAIDNHLFSKEKISEGKETALETSSYSANESADTNKEGDGLYASDGEAAGTSSDSALQNQNFSANDSDQTQNSAGNSAKSVMQTIVDFFKNLIGKQSEAESYPKKLNINFYFVMIGDEKKFGFEQRTIVAGSSQNAAINAMNELLKGPYKSFNFAVIPAGTKLLGVEVLNKIAKLNLSQEFLSESLDSNILDEYIIYTIVDTLTEIPEISAVSFLIDGKEIKEYGSVDLNLPLIRNEKYLNSTP